MPNTGRQHAAETARIPWCPASDVTLLTLLFLFISGAAPIARTDAATLQITRAEWRAEESELRVEGRGASRRAAVAISDDGSGQLIGTVSADNEGRWRFRERDLPTAPCQVRAESDGQVATRAVARAPANCGGGQPPAPGTTSHLGRFTVYEGSKTCNECHLNEAHQAHASLHYQWKGPTPYVTTSGGELQGKLGAMNDFCGYPDINFIGQLVNIDGVTVDGGCSQCHVGQGQKPSPVASQDQLENIDCLVCHSDKYRRKVVKLADGSFRFAPAPEKMTVPLLEAITDIQRTPSRRTCVQCHAYAGGGCNNKRGDIESTHIDPPRSFDVHMASRANGGAGLHCINCHVVDDHKIAGRGADLRATDLDVKVACTNCHTTTPHGNQNLDKHTARVDCTVCHIPAFARITSTDMNRDFSLPADINPTNRLYEAHIDREANVVPEYRFWNGLSRFYNYGAPATPAAGQRVLMGGPEGSIADAGAKIYAFKHHTAVQARDVDTKVLIPLKMGILFQTGDIDRAIRQGATEAGIALLGGYDFVPTERYMGIFHEVAPRESALACTACHDGGTLDSGRMNFALLGYSPLPNRNPALGTCSIGCHSNEEDEWSPSEFFRKLHEKHVTDKRLDCSSCHAFRSAR